MKDPKTSSRPVSVFPSPGDWYRQGFTPTSPLDRVADRVGQLLEDVERFLGLGTLDTIISTIPPSLLNPERPREDSNSRRQAIVDDSGGHKPTEEAWSPFSTLYYSDPLRARLQEQERSVGPWATAPAPYKHPLSHSSAFGISGSRSDGGNTHPSGDGSSGGWSSSSEAASRMRSAPMHRGPSRRFASPTRPTHKPKHCNPSDDIGDGNDTPREQWDPSPGLERSSPASGPPVAAPVKTPWLGGEPDGIDSNVGVRPPLRTIHYPSTFSNPMGGSDARSWGCKGGNPLLSKNKQPLLDCALPDLTRVIRNKTFVASGGYSLVFCADGKKSQGSPTKVAVKILRMSRQENERGDKILKRLKREARVWKLLNHPHIVPLLGLVSGKLGPGLVSPWYSQGNVLQYIRRVPNVRREALCEDVASGLRYLHEQDPPIIHGDLKGANILIGMDGRAALCDFGLSVILDGGPTGFTSSIVGGTIRFMAKEQLDDNGSRSLLSDVYAYACTYAEIMTGDPPFVWYKTSPLIIRAISLGESPYKIGTIISQHNLEFLGVSWDPEPARRPTIADICQTLGILQPVEEI